MEVWLWIGLSVGVLVVVISRRREARRAKHLKQQLEQRRRWDREALIDSEAKAAALGRKVEQKVDAGGDNALGEGYRPVKRSDGRLYIQDNNALGYDSAKRQDKPAKPAPIKKATHPAHSPQESPGDNVYAFDIVGESHCQSALAAIAGPKEAIGKQHHCTAMVHREPSNKYDPNACVVKIDGKKVGYIPKGDNQALIAEKTEAGFPFSVEAVIVGGWSNSQSDGSYGVKLNLEPNGIPATTQQKKMFRYVEGKIPKGLTQNQAKSKARQWDRELNARYTQWEVLEEITEHLQSPEGREEFSIKKPAQTLIAEAFEALMAEGADPEDLSISGDEVVERLLSLKPDLAK